MAYVNKNVVVVCLLQAKVVFSSSCLNISIDKD